MRDRIIRYKARFERGMGWFNWIARLAYIPIGLKIFSFPDSIIMFATAGAMVVFLVVGYVDYKCGIWLEENRYMTTNLNPYFRELEERLKRIENNMLKKGIM